MVAAATGSGPAPLRSAFERPPSAMGMYLRSRLGRDLFLLGSCSPADGAGLPAVTPDPAGVDAALSAVGLCRFDALFYIDSLTPAHPAAGP